MERCNRVLETEPESSLIHWLLWRSFHQKGKYQEAVSGYAKYIYAPFLAPAGTGDAAAKMEIRFEESGYAPRHDVNIAQGLGKNPNKDNAEYKMTGPESVMIDVSECGWAGTDSFKKRAK